MRTAADEHTYHPTPRRPARRRAVALVALVLAAGSLTACAEDLPDPAAAAQELATALQTANPDRAPWQHPDEAATAVTTVMEEVAHLPRTIEVVSLGEQYEADERPAVDAELGWSWDLGGTEWSYTSTATLVLPEDAEVWVVPWSPQIVAPDLHDDARLGLEREPADRGDVLSTDGTALVTDTPVLRLGIDKARAPEDATELRESATALAELVGLDPGDYAERVSAAGPRAFVEAVVVRSDSDLVDVADVEALPGGRALPDELPLAPTSTFARPLLGRAGTATQEVVEESDGAVRPGDIAGLSGLQRQYDAVLRGVPATRVVRRGGEEPAEVLAESPAQDGADVVLTLDREVQQAAEDALADVPQPSGLVALRPSTGEVLAAASGPGSGGFSTATVGQYAPGSTFKVVTALALLRAGTDPDTAVDCTPTVTVDGYSFENYPDYPPELETTIPLRQAIAHSCNTALINARDAVPAADLAAAAAALGVGQDSPTSWPAFLGSVPQDASGTGHAASLIGQGQVLAAPLTMATMTASVVRGEAVTPALVVGPDDAAGTTQTAPAQPLTEVEAEQLRALMYAVVAEGTGVQLADVPGDAVGAKTGTAQHGEGDEARLDSWMVAFQGDLAVGVVVEGGGEGTQAAAPILEDFLQSAP